MDNPLVTIITITRNRADLIGRCIKSIQSQTFTNYEHIIVDGASTDNTEEVVNSFKDTRIRYIKTDEAHSDHTSCWKISFAEAKGKYMCFLDDDDEYQPTKIEKQVNLIESLPDDYGLVYCWMTYYDSQTGKEIRVHKPQLRGDVSLDVVETPAVSGTPIFLVKKDAFLGLGGWVSKEETGVGSDWAFGARFCQHYKVDYVPESLIKVYVNHGHVRMSNAGNYYADVNKKMLKFHSYFLTTYADIYKKYPKKGWYHYNGMVVCGLALGKYKDVWKYYWKLVKAKPTMSNIAIPFKFFIKKALKWK